MLAKLLKPEFEELVERRDWATLREAFSDMDPADVAGFLEEINAEQTLLLFRLLSRDAAAHVFEYLPVERQTDLVKLLGNEQLVHLLNEMAPDDRTRLFEELPAEVTKHALTTLRPDELKVARRLLGYPERSAGRFMTPEYLTLRQDMTVRQALDHVRRNGQDRETLNVLYVTDARGYLLSDVRLQTLVLAEPSARLSELTDRQTISIPATMDREELVGMFEKYDRIALPVTDTSGVLVGMITIDDVLDVAEQEATEDIHRLGGMEALESPYLETGVLEMVRKRGGWLLILFFGQMLTASAMGYYEDELKQAIVLATFIPLVISSGGNAGSQATSLIIRALAVRDVDLSDWWRVLGRELVSGVVLGLGLGLVGLARVAFWPGREDLYGQYFLSVGIAIGASLVGIVLLGTLCGSMLPFILRRLGLDPATASAPFVATIVDVSGLLIYFSVASVVLKGLLL